MKIKCTRENSRIIWKRLNKSELKWLKDSVRSKLKERMRDNNRSNKLLIENSRWKPMISERRKLISWLLDAILKEKNS